MQKPASLAQKEIKNSREHLSAGPCTWVTTTLCSYRLGARWLQRGPMEEGLGVLFDSWSCAQGPRRPATSQLVSETVWPAGQWSQGQRQSALNPCLQGYYASFLWAVWAARGLRAQEGPMKLCRRMDSLSEMFLGTIYISLKLLCHLNA